MQGTSETGSRMWLSPDRDAPVSHDAPGEFCTPVVGHTVVTHQVSLLLMCYFPHSEALRQHELFIFKCTGSHSGSLWCQQTVTDAQHCCDARGLLSTHRNDDTATDCSDGKHAAAEGRLVGKEQF